MRPIEQKPCKNSCSDIKQVRYDFMAYLKFGDRTLGGKCNNSSCTAKLHGITCI
jgi:hypothetical protein